MKIFLMIKWRKEFFERGLIIILMAIILCNGIYAETVQNSNDICLTSECNNTATRIIKSMDLSVDPCDNFYKFTCGNFINTTIPDDKTKVDIFSTLADQVREQLKPIVETDISSNMTKPFRLVKDLYNICMNKTAIEKHGLAPLLSKLKKLGGWPVVEGDNWKEDEFNWTNSIYILKNMGYSVKYLLGVEIGSDIKNNTNTVINIKLPKFGLGSDFLLRGQEDELIKNYKKYMIDIAVLLGAKREYADKELTESLDFEIKLVNKSAFEYTPITIAELEKNYSSIPWLEYFNKILEPHAKVDKNETIYVYYPKFLSNFENLMNTTSKRTQSNFIIWRVIFDSVSFLSEEINRKRIDFLSSANGNTERQPRSEECLNTISQYLPLAIGSLYIKKYFNEDAKNNVTEMVNAIINQFKKTLETVDWMDEVTRKHALKKADSMVTDIAYNEGLLDEKKLEKIYENFEFDINDSYLQTILNLGSHMNEINRGKFRTYFNKSDWVLYLNPTAVNAFNLFHYNIIQFPAAILQGSFFNNDRPRYINYGAVGFLIGHEITHGFDTIGKSFYEDGNLLKWWEASTDDKFWDKALCFYEQYQNYVVKEVGMNVNGLKTITENIADNGGLKTTYLAYRNWAESQNVSEPRLPGLDHYTPTQMFWISASHTWCTAQRPEVLKIQIISDTHSPAEFRVIGAFSNIKEFSDDFKCPVGSPMNPRSKCSMW